MNNYVKLTIPSHLSYLPIVINYGFDQVEPGKFDIIFEQQAMGLNIIIKEKGIPFDPSLIHQYSKDTLTKDLDQKGLGTFLMKQCIDEVSIRNLGRDGIETHLFKHLNNKQIHELISEQDLADVERDKSAKALPKGSVKYMVKHMLPLQAIEVSKGAYSSYGYTYVHEDIYYPDRVRELNKSNAMISYIAITDTGEIIAHNAIENTEGMPPELGVAFTKPKYRGQGCLNALISFILEDAHKLNYGGMYARGVTTHTFSQKTLLKYGFKETALYVSSGLERKYKGIEQKKIQRESVFIMYLYFSTPKKHIIYPPLHHRQMIIDIYQHAGANFQIADSGAVQLLSEQTISHVATDLGSKTAQIFISSYAGDTVAHVKAALRSLCLQRLETIYLHLPLSNPNTATTTQQFEALGFFFSGIMLGDTGSDALILQYLNNYVIDYEQIKVESQYGAKLLDYVRQNDINQQY